MRRRFRLFAGILCLMLVLTGCEFSLESLGLGKLEELFSSDPIICVVTAIDQGVFTVEVLSADSHYDPGDILFVDCTSISGASGFRVGNTVTFSYDYLTAVTVRSDTPYIVADSIAATEYIPPETEEAAG